MTSTTSNVKSRLHSFLKKKKPTRWAHTKPLYIQIQTTYTKVSINNPETNTNFLPLINRINCYNSFFTTQTLYKKGIAVKNTSTQFKAGWDFLLAEVMEETKPSPKKISEDWLHCAVKSLHTTADPFNLSVRLYLSVVAWKLMTAQLSFLFQSHTSKLSALANIYRETKKPTSPLILNYYIYSFLFFSFFLLRVWINIKKKETQLKSLRQFHRGAPFCIHDSMDACV